MYEAILNTQNNQMSYQTEYLDDEPHNSKQLLACIIDLNPQQLYFHVFAFYIQTMT